jgi:(acyl-carrier-protein) S-malonyltransferase
MKRIAGVFSGQGAQYPGMGQALYNELAKVRAIYECAGDILKFDVAKASFEGDEQQLRRTAVAQPVIYTLSIAAFAAAQETLGDVACLGHSLGEYAALYCAGAFSMEDGFRIIGARAAAMERVAATVDGAMYAVLGMDPAAILAGCGQIDGMVMPVNYNQPTQTVISGESRAAGAAAELLAAQGGKIRKLDVESAFHTPLMQPAADELKAAVSGIAFGPTLLPFYSNLTGGKLVIENYPAYFAQHMVSPVRFVEQVAALRADGIAACVEFGPKRTASTLVKKNCREIAVHQVEDPKSLSALADFLAQADQDENTAPRN